MLQSKPRNCRGDTAGFARIERTDATVRHCTIRTIARANVTHQHERRSLMAKAFADVGAAGFLADGVQLQFSEKCTRAKILW